MAKFPSLTEKDEKLAKTTTSTFLPIITKRPTKEKKMNNQWGLLTAIFIAIATILNIWVWAREIKQQRWLTFLVDAGVSLGLTATAKSVTMAAVILFSSLFLSVLLNFIPGYQLKDIPELKLWIKKKKKLKLPAFKIKIEG